MKRKFFILPVLLISTLVLLETAYAQEKILFRPYKYERPTKDVRFQPVSDNERDPITPWFVMALKDGASTTSAPGGEQPHKTLRFGERFFVVAEQGNYLRISKDDRRVDFNLSAQAENYGWVNKTDVLLWQHSLVNRDSKISYKGLILNTVRALRGQQTDYTRIQAFKDPEMRIPADFEARLFEIFYIYKYSDRNNSVLLGRRPYIMESHHSQAEPASGLIGWVDLNRVLEWDHRVAVEPNFNQDAVQERFSKKIPATIFSASPTANPDRCAVEFMRGQVSPGCDVAWNDDIFDARGDSERKPGYWRRFPVIGDYGADIYKLMVMGELRGETGVIQEDVDIMVRQRLNQLTEKARNINVVFVIDGTNSMGPYYESAINSVQRIVHLFTATGEAHKNLQFGYVIYRDYLERDRLVETRQLTPYVEAQQIMEGLRRVDARDYYDIHADEAVFYGLKTAFDRVFTDRDETNILIHIGDAGNHSRNDPSQVVKEEIVQLMAEYKCYYIAFQAHHSTQHEAYDDFPRQVREIMSSASDQLYREWVDLLGQGIIDKRPQLRQVDRNISRIDEGPPMVLIASERGREMNTRYLEDEITKAITDINTYTDNVVERAREMLERGRGIEVLAGKSESLYASSFAPGVYNFLVRMGLDEDVLRHYYSSNVQLVVEGYASRNHSSLNRPLFAPVLLLQAVEFASIITQLNHLLDATQASGDVRDLLYNAWIELLKRHVGVRPEGGYDEMSLEEATSMVFGVPMRSDMLQQIQLKDIHDLSVFPNHDLNRYLNQLRFKSVQLYRISNTKNYPYSFSSNDILYYWIDVDFLP